MSPAIQPKAEDPYGTVVTSQKIADIFILRCGQTLLSILTDRGEVYKFTPR